MRRLQQQQFLLQRQRDEIAHHRHRRNHYRRNRRAWRGSWCNCYTWLAFVPLLSVIGLMFILILILIRSNIQRWSMLPLALLYNNQNNDASFLSYKGHHDNHHDNRQKDSNSENDDNNNNHNNTVITIAYAVTVTSCQKSTQEQTLQTPILDAAAVLKHSIHLNSIQTPQSGSRYNYTMIAFVHPDAISCAQRILQKLNYTVLTKHIPFDIQQIKNPLYRHRVDRTGCCGAKEWLKLYSYTLTEYPVVVHLDLDCLILKPLDPLFDTIIPQSNSMTTTNNRRTLPKVYTMWDDTNNNNNNNNNKRRTIHHVNTTTNSTTRVDAYFTRDYGMLVQPRWRQPHQVGIQGGFLVVRPDLEVFTDFIQLILEGNFTDDHGWGGPALQYGGYYGAATIQGLAAMYYSHYHPEHAVELNRCRFNNMRDIPYQRKYEDDVMYKNMTKAERPCFTLESNCEDCRETPMEDIYTIHMTHCGKPWKCLFNINPHKANYLYHPCTQFHYEWYRIRHLLECQWKAQKGGVCHTNTERTLEAYKLPLKELSFGVCAPGSFPGRYTPILETLIPSGGGKKNLMTRLHEHE